MQICKRVANLHPGCIFGHVNGVLRICTSGANLHSGANLLLLSRWSKLVQIVYFPYVLIRDFDILQTFSVYDFVLNDLKGSLFIMVYPTSK